MEVREGKRMETASRLRRERTAHTLAELVFSSAGFAPHPPPPSPRDARSLLYRAQSELMKISIKSDKFTGYFDKFLKNYIFANDCNIKSISGYLSVFHSDLQQK